MALQVNLTLSKNYFLPGEVVQVCVQIFNDADSTSQTAKQDGLEPGNIHVKELSFQAHGSERTDSSFIHNLHRPDIPADTIEARKRIRNIFSTESAALVSNKVLEPHAVQSFQLRFRLPATLPPSFRGSAMRFLYLIQVKAIYEVHRGGQEAVVYETVASTSLMVWPGVGGTSSSAPMDRRMSSVDTGSGGDGPADTQGASSSGQGFLGLGAGKGSSARISSSGGGGLDDAFQRQSGAASVGGGPTGPPPYTPTASMAVHGGDDGEVPMCDYALGRKCKIRWHEVRTSGPAADSPGAEASLSGSPGSGGFYGLPSSSSFGSVTMPGVPLRGVIPFGVNRPFSPVFPPLAGPETEDTDTEDDKDEGHGTGDGSGTAAGGEIGGSSPGAGGRAHVQRQVSGATSMAGPLNPFGRQSGVRRGSLFGKTYSLNVGDQPLLRVVLQAPLEVPLQPGATFGGVLDFRQPLLGVAVAAAAAAAAAAAGGVAGSGSGAGGVVMAAGEKGGPERPLMACYDVAVLLESEEVISPECRPNKRDGSGLPAGAPYIVRRLHAEHHELTLDCALTSFTFSLPATATPSFRTPMVALRWVLRFELTVGPRLDVASMDKRARSPKPAMDQLVWSLPLIVRAPTTVLR